jgi:hypothetical protein
MNYKIRIHLIVILTLCLLLLLPSFGVAQRVVDEANSSGGNIVTLQDTQVGTRPIPVPFNLLPKGELSPEIPREGKSDQIATCPNGFVPARWSIFGFFGSTQWRDVGTWDTIEVSKALKAVGNVQFKLWVTYTGSGSVTGTFDLYFMREKENIAEVTNFQVRFENGMSPTLVTAEAPLINQTPFQVGDVFSVYIRCRNSFDGAQILYGSANHLSGVIMYCDPITIVDIHAAKDHVCGLYEDIFQVKPNVMTFIAKVDNVVIDTDPDVGSQTVEGKSYRTITWATKLNPGEHNIEISISYTGADNSTIVSLAKLIKIEKPAEPTILGVIPLWLFNFIILPIILICIAVVIWKGYNIYQDRKWEKEMGYR